MEHTYVQIDKDGTVECTKCGLRNSDPTAYFPENIMCEVGIISSSELINKL